VITKEVLYVVLDDSMKRIIKKNDSHIGSAFSYENMSIVNLDPYRKSRIYLIVSFQT